MIVEDFSIVNEDRLEEFTALLTKKMRRSSLREPITQNDDGTYHVSVRCNLEDALRLEQMLTRWYHEDKMDQESKVAPSALQSLMNKFFSKS